MKSSFRISKMSIFISKHNHGHFTTVMLETNKSSRGLAVKNST